MNNDRRDRQARINEISQQIEDLSIELNNLLNIDDNQQGNQEVEQQHRHHRRRRPAARTEPAPVQAIRVQVPAEEQDFQINQEVEITNNHRGLRGVRGTIRSISRYQVTINIPGRAQPVTRAKRNVRIIRH